MAPPLAAVSSSSPLFSPSSSRPIRRCHAPPPSISFQTRGRSPTAAAAAESSVSTLLEVRGLTASVKETGQQILAGVDLTIREGEVRVGSSWSRRLQFYWRLVVRILLNWDCKGSTDASFMPVFDCHRFMRLWGRTAPARAPSQK